MGRTKGPCGPHLDGGRNAPADRENGGGFARDLQKFPLGEVVITPDAALVLSVDEVSKAVARHSRGDWGHVDADTRRENEGGIGYSRLAISSHYRSDDGLGFWVMTEPERRRTVVMLGSIEESSSYT